MLAPKRYCGHHQGDSELDEDDKLFHGATPNGIKRCRSRTIRDYPHLTGVPGNGPHRIGRRMRTAPPLVAAVLRITGSFASFAVGDSLIWGVAMLPPHSNTASGVAGRKSLKTITNNPLSPSGERSAATADVKMQMPRLRT